ncbi:hypothetical protein RFI_08072 [Reticulomyxa filosa]|uniref:Uncharacterized protein n=1 Tax=Reticulomyxa filosa TaxID=46433 RepID=X6NRZ6_RETFI|nr:hypothetical protein RFI_08072 [Reticulomyxa filosa]|eukprot:ETO29055.1 hypothetical protein RFI_08072 [Reticulomyxa filosa]
MFWLIPVDRNYRKQLGGLNGTSSIQTSNIVKRIIWQQPTNENKTEVVHKKKSRRLGHSLGKQKKVATSSKLKTKKLRRLIKAIANELNAQECKHDKNNEQSKKTQKQREYFQSMLKEFDKALQSKEYKEKEVRRLHESYEHSLLRLVEFLELAFQRLNIYIDTIEEKTLHLNQMKCPKSDHFQSKCNEHICSHGTDFKAYFLVFFQYISQFFGCVKFIDDVQHRVIIQYAEIISFYTFHFKNLKFKVSAMPFLI